MNADVEKINSIFKTDKDRLKVRAMRARGILSYCGVVDYVKIYLDKFPEHEKDPFMGRIHNVAIGRTADEAITLNLEKLAEAYSTAVDNLDTDSHERASA